MKNYHCLFAVILLLSVYACCEPEPQKVQQKPLIDSVVSVDTLQMRRRKTEAERAKTREKLEAQWRSDSILLAQTLDEALQEAQQNFDKDTFSIVYGVSDTVNHVAVKVYCNYFFTKDHPHLVIRRKLGEAVYIDIYAKINGRFENVITQALDAYTYVNDTIRDINGDGLKDFVVDWHATTGCCPRSFIEVFLLRPDHKTFSQSFEFLNPTFSPKEKVIRGFGYGHPGETEMYKYKWNGEHIDTLAYVYYEKDADGEKTGMIIIDSDLKENVGEKRYKTMPKEYQEIFGYDWFTGELEEE